MAKKRYDDLADFSESTAPPKHKPNVAPESDWDLEATHVVPGMMNIGDDEITDVGRREATGNLEDTTTGGVAVVADEDTETLPGDEIAAAVAEADALQAQLTEDRAVRDAARGALPASLLFAAFCAATVWTLAVFAVGMVVGMLVLG